MKVCSFPSRPIMIGGEIYRNSRYGVGHPLSIERVTPVMDLTFALQKLLPSIRKLKTEIITQHKWSFTDVEKDKDRSQFYSKKIGKTHAMNSGKI